MADSVAHCFAYVKSRIQYDMIIEEKSMMGYSPVAQTCVQQDE